MSACPQKDETTENQELELRQWAQRLEHLGYIIRWARAVGRGHSQALSSNLVKRFTHYVR